MTTNTTTLNEGRDLNPGDTHTPPESTGRVESAQRRPGPESRRHASSSRLPGLSDSTLNEGRDLNPGDTSTAPT